MRRRYENERLAATVSGPKLLPTGRPPDVRVPTLVLVGARDVQYVVEIAVVSRRRRRGSRRRAAGARVQ
jgi:hypothetical protein